MRLFFSAGEASGDAYAAALLREMRARLPLLSRDDMLAKAGTAIASWFKEEGALQRRVRDVPSVGSLFDAINREVGWARASDDLTVHDAIAAIGRGGNDEAVQALYRLATIPGYGLGGRKFMAEAETVLVDSSLWGAIGIVEAARVLPRVARGYFRAREILASRPPGLFIPIDFGFVNIKLARLAKAHGWSVLYYMPPGSWRKDKQGSDLPAIANEIVTPFPWSSEILNRMGASAHFFGHPLKQMIADALASGPPAKRENLLAILPGSRIHEVERNLPIIAASIDGLPLDIELAAASSLTDEKLRTVIDSVWPAGCLKPKIIRDTYRLLSEARAAIVCSGTATLEAALCGCPCLVMYRGSKAMEIEFALRKPRFNYISLPNILLDRPAIPELIQRDAEPRQMRRLVEDLLTEGPARASQLEDFREIDLMSGPRDAVSQTAGLALKMLGEG